MRVDRKGWHWELSSEDINSSDVQHPVELPSDEYCTAAKPRAPDSVKLRESVELADQSRNLLVVLEPY